jgi:ATP-dependent DNA helicase
LLLFPSGPAGPNFPVIVSTYEIVMADIKALARYNWKYVVVDEGHRLKNFECKLIRDLRMLPADNKLLLTGARFAQLLCLPAEML